MKKAAYSFEYESNQQWSLWEGSHFFLHAPELFSSPRGLFSISISP